MSGKKRVVSKRHQQQERRKFLRSVVITAGVVTVSLLGYIPGVKGWVNRLRPPGALQEDQFLSSCIKCGQCVQVCPVNAIKLMDIDSGFGIGTPYIDAREQACDFSCDGLQCVLACPTGSLAHELDYPADVRMGVARLDQPSKCLAIQGKGFKGLARGADYKGKLRYDEIDRWNPIAVNEHPYDLELCDLCVRQCPIEIRIAQCAEQENVPENQARVAQRVGNECPPKHAIAIEEVNGIMMPVIKEGCVGCGVCEMICPPEPAAIVIDSSITLEAKA
jgi:ferredoxin-type protein NapG